MKIPALDLSFNRIMCPSWEAFLPPVRKLNVYVQHMDFGGNCLPPLRESEYSLQSFSESVSLSVTYHSQCGDPWVDSWTRKSSQFKQLAYGAHHAEW